MSRGRRPLTSPLYVQAGGRRTTGSCKDTSPLCPQLFMNNNADGVGGEALFQRSCGNSLYEVMDDYTVNTEKLETPNAQDGAPALYRFCECMCESVLSGTKITPPAMAMPTGMSAAPSAFKSCAAALLFHKGQYSRILMPD